MATIDKTMTSDLRVDNRGNGWGWNNSGGAMNGFYE
jgi:hypothetical protein